MEKEQKFVCPDLNLIDKKGKELKLKEDTIKKAKDFAMQYFEKTYKSPRYSSPKFLMPAFLYIAAIHGGIEERKTQKEIADTCDISIVTIYKWYTDIANTIDVDINI